MHVLTCLSADRPVTYHVSSTHEAPRKMPHCLMKAEKTEELLSYGGILLCLTE